jgi:hypothetical protein
MKKFVTLLAMAALLAITGNSLAGNDKTQAAKGNLGNPGVIPPQALAYGMTYAQWGAAWWQWALSVPASESPFFDEVGSAVANGQSGDVWFLAGVFNASGTVVRHCTIPPGKALFFPLLNCECSNLEGPPWYGGNEQELHDCVMANPIGPVKFAEIDGVSVKNIDQYYSLSPMFNFSVPENNILGVPGPTTGISMSQGVYLMLAPLSAGTHVVHFGGGDPGVYFLDITYVITVGDPASLGNPGVIPPWATAFGKSYSQWFGAWYNYVFPKSLDVLPFAYGTDPTYGQSGQVWFLGGSFVSPSAVRDITVPPGTALFVSLINAECSTVEPDPFHGSNEAELRACAKNWIDNAVGVWCTIDGVPLNNLDKYRSQTPLINFSAPDNNITFVPGPQTGQSVGDGYNILLTPLPVGTHIIHFGASVPVWGFTEDILYTVTVQPTASAL